MTCQQIGRNGNHTGPRTPLLAHLTARWQARDHVRCSAGQRVSPASIRTLTPSVETAPPLRRGTWAHDTASYMHVSCHPRTLLTQRPRGTGTGREVTRTSDVWCTVPRRVPQTLPVFPRWTDGPSLCPRIPRGAHSPSLRPSAGPHDRPAAPLWGRVNADYGSPTAQCCASAGRRAVTTKPWLCEAQGILPVPALTRSCFHSGGTDA